MRSIRYGAVFGAFATSLFVFAWLSSSAVAVLLAWVGLGFSQVAFAYFGGWPAVFGKRPDGTLAIWSVLIGWPVLLLGHAIVAAKRASGREPANDEVAPDIFVGRLPIPRELPPQVAAIIDLTAEFNAHGEVRRHPGYRNFALLDDTFPEPSELDRMVAELVDVSEPILIHCAAGHGRSATLAAALALARGHFSDVAEAEAGLQAARPGIRLRATQRERLTQWFAGFVERTKRS